MTIIRQFRDLAVVEVEDRFYVVQLDERRGQVKSWLAKDAPSGGGQWISRWSDAGVKYVASGATRKTAVEALRRERKWIEEMEGAPR